MIENPIGSFADTYRKVTINPAISAGAQGTLAFGVGTVGWDRLIETLRSLLRRPVSYLYKIPPKEFDAEMEDIKNDKKMRILIPALIGVGVTGTSLATSYRPNEEYGGLLSWNAKAKPLDEEAFRGYIMPGSQNAVSDEPMDKSAALHKFASDIFEYGGFVPKFDPSQIINAPATKRELFTNDPWMQNDSFTRNTGIAIFSDAQNRAGSSNITMGTLHDSAADKFKSKFSLMGVTGIAAKTMLANLGADLLVNAVGSMTGIPQSAREDLISAGTWYGAAKAIFN